MRAFLRVNLFLLPIPILVAGAHLGHPLTGAAAALAWAVAVTLRTHRRTAPPPFALGLLAGLAAALLGLAGGWIEEPATAEAPLMAGLALGALASLVLRRPWTATFSEADYGGVAGSPIFHDINMLVSGVWTAVFAWLALAAATGIAPLLQWGPLALAAVVSLALPALLVSRGLKRMIRGRAGAWTPPRFGGPCEAGLDCDVAVIGAGIGGLTAAALLADAGLAVEVFEQHALPGGFAHTWTRRARARDETTGNPLIFRFDCGVHDVSGWQPGGTVRTLFERLGIDRPEEWVRLDHRYVLDGLTLDIPRDWRRYRDRLAAEFPHEAAGLRELFDEVHTIYRSMFATARFWGGFPGMPGSPSEALAFAAAHPLAMTWMERPWQPFVDRHVRDPAVHAWVNALAGYVSDRPDRLLVRDMVPIFGFYFEGGYYPLGGSGRIAVRLVEAVEARGGRVRLRQSVTRLLLADGAASGLVVQSVDGAERAVRCRAVVCNADPKLLAEQLLAGEGTAANLLRQTGTLAPACSAVGVCLGLRGRLDLPPVIHIDGPDGGAGLVVPSAVDPAAAPAGYSTVEILKLLPPAQADAWFPPDGDKEGPDYRTWRHSASYLERKQMVGDALIRSARAVIPDLDERIVYRTDASPITYHRYARTSNGSIYGIRASRGPAPVKTAIPGLVLAGAATHGPGVEAVVISGAFAAEALMPGVLANGQAGSDRNPATAAAPTPQGRIEAGSTVG